MTFNKCWPQLCGSLIWPGVPLSLLLGAFEAERKMLQRSGPGVGLGGLGRPRSG